MPWRWQAKGLLPRQDSAWTQGFTWRFRAADEMETVTVSPGILAKAMAAWDKGEDFIYNGP